MKVGVFLDEYIPEDGGGYTFQAEVFYALVRLAASSEHEFTLITAQPRDIADQLEGSGIGLMGYKEPNFLEKAFILLTRNTPSPRNKRRWESAFERRLRQAGIEFIWFLGPRAAHIDLPYMTIVLDLQHRLQPWFPEVSRWSQWEIRERSFSSFLRRAAAIIAGTQAGKAEIESFYQVPGDRIHILPHPTPAFALQPPNQANGDVLAAFDLPDDYLFYPAQFWPHKNHINLLRALSHLKDDGLTVPLVLVGADFGNREFVEEQVRALGLEDQVRILGFVSKVELIALYRRALALTYLTFFGPENLPPMEAFALGTPVIASAVSGAEEQMGDAALLVDPLKPAEIATAIRQLHSDAKLRQDLIARGQKRAAQWTVDDFVRRAFQILDGFAPVRRVWRD